MLSLAILLVCCGVALARPVWGIAIVLVLLDSLFNLHQYAVVRFAGGYVGAQDLLLLCVCAGAFWEHWRRRLPPGVSGQPLLPMPGSLSALRKAPPHLFLIVLLAPYLLWLAISAVNGIFQWQGTRFLNLSLRYAAGASVPWGLGVSVWLLRHRAGSVLRIMFAVAVATAAVHLAIQALDLRGVMLAAYKVDTAEYAFVYESKAREIEREAIVRGLPQGTFLMMLCFAYALARHATGVATARQRVLLIGFCALQLIALAITVTRSILAELLAAGALVVCLAAALKLMRMAVFRRVMLAACATALAMGCLVASWSDLAGFWRDRLDRMDDDVQIFSAETVRGKDNLASLEAVADAAMLGWGCPRYPDRYSLRREPPTDIHPLLTTALFGGIPAVLLLVVANGLVMHRACGDARRHPGLRKPLLPFVVVVAVNGVINLTGGGGTISGVGLVPFALFMGLMAVEWEAAVQPRRPAAVVGVPAASARWRGCGEKSGRPCGA